MMLYCNRVSIAHRLLGIKTYFSSCIISWLRRVSLKYSCLAKCGHLRVFVWLRLLLRLSRIPRTFPMSLCFCVSAVASRSAEVCTLFACLLEIRASKRTVWGLHVMRLTLVPGSCRPGGESSPAPAPRTQHHVPAHPRARRSSPLHRQSSLYRPGKNHLVHG